MTDAREHRLEPAVLVIFGITGDLSGRYLLPSLYHLVKDGRLDARTEILGISRGATTTDELFERVELCVNEVDQICDPDVVTAMRARTNMFQMDLDDPSAYDGLLQKLNDIETAKGVCMHRVYYLSIPPKAYQSVVRLMGEHGLNTSCQHGVAATRLLVEKPFGRDLASAETLISATGKHFSEDQVFRIDHYVAKPGTQAMLAARRDDALADVWDGRHVAGIDIIAKEKIGIEGRAAFYDPLGALRDFIQSHLVQLAGLITMTLPATDDSQQLHAAKQAALDAIEPVAADKVAERVVRGQYRGYRDEVGDATSTTETYASVTVYSQASAWPDVPITMLTGKALNERQTDVVLRLRTPLKDGQTELRWPLQGGPNAYERVLTDAVAGDHAVFVTADEVLASWRILQPVLDAWQQGSDDLIIYEPGSAGPA